MVHQSKQKKNSLPNNYSQQQQYTSNNIMNTNGSAMSGGAESGAKTFQNTINIGSFINEINNQQKSNTNQAAASESMTNLQHQGLFNSCAPSGDPKNQFSNTIENVTNISEKNGK